MRRLIAVLRRNPLVEAFTDARGVIRPIRRSEGYSEEIVRERARQRQATGLTAREQQKIARSPRVIDRGSRVRHRLRGARLVATRPVTYTTRYGSKTTSYMQLVVPGEKGPLHRVPYDPREPGAANRAALRLREIARERGIALANLDAYVGPDGVIHPIRRSEGYSQAIVDERARLRRETGLSAADQQLSSRFERLIAGAERPRVRRRREDPEEQLYRLEREREALREALAESPASEYVELVGEHGTARGALGLIPMEVARRYLPRPPEHYRTARVRRAGHDYLRREYVLDELADSLGYRDSRDFEEALQRAIRDRRRLAALDSEIRRLERSTRRRNPTGPSVLTRLLEWLRR